MKSKKWIPPEKRMKTYADYGLGDDTIPMDDPRWKNIRWNKFVIIVPTEWDKQELQAAFEYFHDNKLIDTDYLAVNALAHAYCEPPDSVSPIVVDEKLYNKTSKKLKK
jgi:hypothetical protein